MDYLLHKMHFTFDIKTFVILLSCHDQPSTEGSQWEGQYKINNLEANSDKRHNNKYIMQKYH